jgi:hypothetical protein
MLYFIAITSTSGKRLKVFISGKLAKWKMAFILKMNKLHSEDSFATFIICSQHIE